MSQLLPKEEANNMSQLPPKKRKRSALKKPQVLLEAWVVDDLMSKFLERAYITYEEAKRLAVKYNITWNRVIAWFKKQRQFEKIN